MGFAPTWLRQVSPPPASQNHFNHCFHQRCSSLSVTTTTQKFFRGVEIVSSNSCSVFGGNPDHKDTGIFFQEFLPPLQSYELCLSNKIPSSLKIHQETAMHHFLLSLLVIHQANSYCFILGSREFLLTLQRLHKWFSFQVCSKKDITELFVIAQSDCWSL